MSDKYIRALRRMAADRSLSAKIAETLLKLHTGDAEWEESKHPRGKGGKFVSKGSGSFGSGSSSGGESGKSSSSTHVGRPSGLKSGQTKIHGSLRRDAKASEGMMQKFQDTVRGKDQNRVLKDTEKFLKEMKPGTAFRYNEPSQKGQFDWMVKLPDGKFLYTNKYDGTQSVLSSRDVAADIAVYGNPEKSLGDFSVPQDGASDRDAYWSAKRQFAGLKENAGDHYTGKRCSIEEGIKNSSERASGQKSFPKDTADVSAAYTNIEKDENGRVTKAGVPIGKLTNGSGVTNIDRGDILQPNPDDKVYNTLSEHCMETTDGRLVLTPEREKLHQEIIQGMFENARKPTDGKKVFTMLGGGSAAGKGTIQGANSGVKFPSKEESPVLDADAIKESLPEYVDTAFSDDHEKAASFAHEESSALVKRAMQTAMANGYNFTLDGTGDGSLKSMRKKIEEAQNNGYEVNGVYCTCPTDLAVERSKGRSKTDKYGRLVQEATVRDIHEKVSALFPQVAPLMDHCELYDTAQPGGKPVLIATCKKGEEPKAVPGREKLYQAFLDKATPKTNG